MPEQPEDQWLSIVDFSPGCYSHTNTQGTVDRLLGAPKGAADARQTFSCSSLPGGGLAALPGLAAAPLTWFGTNEPTNYIVGFVGHDQLNNGDTEIVVIWEADDGTHHMWDAYSYIIETAAHASIVSTFLASASGIFGSPYPQFSRSAKSTQANTVPGIPVIVFPSGGPAQSAVQGQVYMYPDPDAATTMGARALISGTSSIAGQVIAHQNRILVLSGIDYDHPVGGGFLTNEQINFTDPANSETLGDQQTVLGAEAPFGYGAAGSISSGELVLIKKRGGGLIVTGDIFSPSVTQLPGMQSTGNMYGNAASGLLGLAYCALDEGCWMWNGSNTSEKVSGNLDDNFFLPSGYYGGMQSNNYGFFCDWSGDKLYVSNNWMLDSKSKAWWKYYPDASQGGTDLYYHQSIGNRFLYAAPLQFLSSAAQWLFQFDHQTPAQTYQWQSMPLAFDVETHDRRLDVREVILTVSSSTATTSAFVQIWDQGSIVWTGNTQTIAAGGPQMLRWNAAGLGVTDPQVLVKVINSAATDNAIVHGIDIRWRPRAHQAAGN